MHYRNAVARLYSLERSGIKLGLENIRRFCTQLNDPHKRFPSVHVAGTNGKGSVTAFLESILGASGLRVGRFTSPHLRDFRERIHFGGRPIARGRVAEFTARHWTTVRRGRYSYFEVVTALAFDAFAQMQADIAVIEVGLGGRFDATNVLKPALSIITHIDYDHERILGNSLRQIAFEKSGIIKKGVPVLVGPLPRDAMEVIARIADRRHAPLVTAADVLRAMGRGEGRALLESRWTPALPGDHQLTNCGIAIAGAWILRAMDYPITVPDLRRGVCQARWSARFQVTGGRPRIVYDVAHNASGMQAFAHTWKQVFGLRRAVGLFTTRADKNYRAMTRDLADCLDTWIGCPLPHGDGIPKEEMVSLARDLNLKFQWTPTVRKGLHEAVKAAGASGLVAVVGSHFLVGEVIPAQLVANPAVTKEARPTVPWRDIERAVRPVG